MANAYLALVSPIADAGVAHFLDTVNAFTSGKLQSWRTNAVEKAFIDFEGSVNGHDGIFGGKVTVAESITTTSTEPNIVFIETGAAADNTRWDWDVDNEAFTGRAVNDAVSQATSWVTVTRTGQTIDSVAFGGTGFTIAGDVGFFGQAATSKPTGVAVSAAGIHAALVTLNLIAA